jgi:hypothetical protein
MHMTMMLADAAQEVNGKLYVLGGDSPAARRRRTP